jgi:hypothetical protein
VKCTTDAITRSIIQESARKKEGKTVADKNVYEVVWPHNTLGSLVNSCGIANMLWKHFMPCHEIDGRIQCHCN